MRVRDVLRQAIKGRKTDLSVKEVRKIMDVKAALFQQWLARDLIPSKMVQAGKRTWRRFDVREVPRLILISELVGQGLPISEVAGNVDTILNWKYKEGVAPGAILWFRQINLIFFAAAEKPLPEILRERNCASCILLSVDELKRKIALAAANDGSE